MWKFRKIIVQRVLLSDFYAFYVLRRHSFLAEMGWFESWRSKRSVNGNGEPIPWITYPALLFLESRVSSEWSVFEYGSGNSTLWWSGKVSKVVSCEHNENWYKAVKNLVGQNVELHLRPLTDPKAYVDAPQLSQSAFDVIVVDGEERDTCLLNACRWLKPGGIIILDDSDRPQYKSAIENILSSGFKMVDFDGPGPIIAFRWRTSIFYRGENCANL